MILAVIPARWASTRFPGKPMAVIGGKTMIQRVYEQVQLASGIDQIVIATDHEGIAEHARTFGAEVVITRADHPSGTDRCAEAAQQFPAAEWVVNVQGDEPFIQPAQIDLLVHTLRHSQLNIATLVKKITQSERLFNPNVVKAVCSPGGEALYFSRHPVPYVRGYETDRWMEVCDFYQHIGIYGFRRDTLMQLSALAPAPLEVAESLEQLRWLSNGHRIAVGITTLETIGIDTPEDLNSLNQ